jgi:hypothetical protein
LHYFFWQNGEMRKLALSYPLLLLVFWTGLMLVADYVVIDASVRQAWSVNFASTLGKMVRSEVGQGVMRHRGVEFSYDYTVNGVNYTGRRYRYDDRNAALEYSATVDAFPRRSARRVFYNPRDPADSLLAPGLEGCDLLLLLFATPINAATLALWAAVAQSRRDEKLAGPAGGIRIHKRAGEIRAQLAAFSPTAAALAGLGAGSFLFAFPVVAIGGFAPSMTAMLGVWLLVLAGTATAFVWTLTRNRSGRFDLRIDEVSQTVTLPQLESRIAPLTLARNEIRAVSLQRRVTKTPSGDYFSYWPAIDRLDPESGSPAIKLGRWGWTEARASAFGKWLSGQLGVEFKEGHLQ